MNIKWLEDSMYQMSDLFMAPVLILLVLLFGYSLFATGEYLFQMWQRKQNKANFQQSVNQPLTEKQSISLAGYPLIQIAKSNPNISKDQLDVAALELLQGVRSVSRLAPMLGLIATMIPMGPALKSLADGNVQGISDNLIVAFSAVIFGLVIASITFWIASDKKKWLAKELVIVQPMLNQEPMGAPISNSTSPSNVQENEISAASLSNLEASNATA